VQGAAAAAIFIICLAAHWLAYRTILDPGLRQPETERQQAALKRWAAFVVAFEVVIVASAVAYVLVSSRGAAGVLWILPPLAAVLGGALGLQLGVGRILRSLRG
jgi:hypothetical protein